MEFSLLDQMLQPQARPSLESTATAATVATQEEEDEEPFWEDPDWVPVTKAGKQRSPNMIRNELQRYIDRTSGVTVTSVLGELDVSSKSYYKFMNPKNYKEPWNACQSETYWQAARFLERKRHEKKDKKESGKKRAAVVENTTNDTMPPPPAKKSKADAQALMEQIMAYQATDVSETRVYDSCQDIIKKCKEFLAQKGVTKAAFLSTALGGLNSNSLGRFLMTKKQDGAGQLAYRRAWVFFEKKRLMEGKPKSKTRVKHEAQYPQGYPLEAPSEYSWYVRC